MKILILGGGISGLSAAWYARKAYPDARITLLEKGSRLGGCIETVNKGGITFEKGPRTFSVSRSKALLQLIEELGLKEEILFSEKAAANRYLWHKGSLRSMRSFLPMLVFPLMREAFLAKKNIEDESIYDFAARRFSQKIAETLFDPMVLGIFAGDIRKLSLRSCFPFLYEWEQKGQSVLRSIFSGNRDGRLFTLQRGLGSLINEIQKKLEIDLVLNCRVEALSQEGIYAQGKLWAFDQIISALPGPVIGRLTGLWPDFPVQSLWVVTIAFKNDVLLQKGFGYLVPSQEKEALLGCVWDSVIFSRPDQKQKTILTAMVRNQGDEEWAKKEAVAALHRHLGIQEIPDFVACYLAQEAIPQFEVGYGKRLRQFQVHLKKMFPSMTLVGNYLEGASVNACVQASRLSL